MPGPRHWGWGLGGSQAERGEPGSIWGIHTMQRQMRREDWGWMPGFLAYLGHSPATTATEMGKVREGHGDESVPWSSGFHQVLQRHCSISNQKISGNNFLLFYFAYVCNKIP